MNVRELIEALTKIGEPGLEVFIQVNSWGDEEIEDGEVLEISDSRSILRHLDGVFILADQTEP
jgi:hypothetical protein